VKGIVPLYQYRSLYIIVMQLLCEYSLVMVVPEEPKLACLGLVPPLEVEVRNR
jgi:hypothetical protein